MSMRGFTVLEALLSIALTVIIVGTAAPLYISFQTRTDLDTAASVAAQSFRRAQTRAQAVENDSAWGLKVQSGSIVIFKGASYAARDAAQDETYELPASLSASGATEVVYSKFEGAPSPTGSLTLTSSAISESRTVTINAKGMVSF